MGRPKKTIPENYDQLVASIKHGKLDNRTSFAKEIKDTMQALSDNPSESIKSIIRYNIAVLGMLQTELMRESQGNPILKDGRLDKRLSDDLLSVQKTMIQNCNLLSLIEGINKKKWRQDDKKARNNAGNAVDIAAFIIGGEDDNQA